jgi:hypothetical protein
VAIEPITVTIRLSAFVDPQNPGRGFASISDSPAGASPNQTVELDALKHPADWEYSVLLYELSKDHRDEVARDVGKNLYDVFFKGEIKEVFRRTRATAPKGRVRLAVDVSESLIAVPWELLHDGNDFLLRQDCSIIRVARELPPDVAYFGPVTRVGLVACTPDFDATGHLKTLEATLLGLGVNTTICLNPTRQELMRFLEREHIDALYFLGHGRNGQILLKPDLSEIGWLDAGDLAMWLPDPIGQPERRVNLVSLFSCGTAEHLPQEGVFSAVAQRLMLSKRVGTVLAMQAKIELGHAARIAEKFFEEVVCGGDPEAALIRARTTVGNIWARSIPVLYTHVKGPDAFKKNRLSRLLAAEPGDKVAVSLPGFKMGLKYEVYEAIKEPLFEKIGSNYNYRGRTYARSDVDAAKELLDLLTQVGDLDCVTILDDVELPDVPVTFYFGSGSHQFTSALLKEEALQFKFEWGDESCRIIDLKNNRKYEIPSPVKYAANYNKTDDWGFIEKTIKDGRCSFFLCGIGDRGTRGCAYYLARNWQELLDTHHDSPFAELLRFPGGLDHTRGQQIDRAANKWGAPITP